MNLLKLHERRMAANIPVYAGFYVDPHYLPERKPGEDMLDFAKRADSATKDYLRAVVTWTRDYEALAPNGWRSFVHRVDRAREVK